ncbi:hypothetical protein [Sinorhizobium medicae]|uniref:Terminase large subunit gp17-like C-terminal domain-containing protein n=1 Tax=Sinorhizobium medicae TaxID=110321 RepID=A0ABX4TGP8_9HYPH|nr:hypothetical protein [Sinorhizobium medicae]PLT97187.1 hypothetical protein BMJ33_26380 [Sinorhizobium medicae]PLU23631.1 hypothetical protein BMJ29_04480 [Sinorhizobium medicae]PLU79515.1 hypothetical protein BMJ19_12465 [Sinorhizobium medicae]
MPLKIVRDFSDPNHTRRVIYEPDRADAPRTRPRGSLYVDPDTGRWRSRRDEASPVKYFVGLDLGQAVDFTAFAVVEKGETGLAVPHLDRVRGLSYPQLVKMTADLMGRPPLAGASQLVVDATGVGRAVLDMLRSADLQPVAVTIHGGDKVTGARRAPRVPKRDLINTLLVVLQAGALKISSELQHAGTLARELSEMRRKLSAAGHDSYGVWRDGEHDDLVLALALAVWRAERTAHAAVSPSLHPGEL